MKTIIDLKFFNLVYYRKPLPIPPLRSSYLNQKILDISKFEDRGEGGLARVYGNNTKVNQKHLEILKISKLTKKI